MKNLLRSVVALIASPFGLFRQQVREIPMEPRYDRASFPPPPPKLALRKHPMRGIAVPAHYNIPSH